jgi:ubiquinone/menaquinone biosynthesis C-methylase UbiE
VSEPDFIDATRASYNTLASYYAGWIVGELGERPLERGLLAGFAELVTATGNPAVADVGCGPGRVTTHLAGLGLAATGIDLSPEMIAMARRDHPDLAFEVGSMLDLDVPDASLGGVLAWYSIIHVPDDLLPTAFGEFFRVLVPGGYLFAGFQAGDEVVHRTRSRATDVELSLDFHHRQPDRVADLMRQAGFEIRARMLREADKGGEYPEDTSQGFVIARRPS